MINTERLATNRPIREFTLKLRSLLSVLLVIVRKSMSWPALSHINSTPQSAAVD